jgi:hypothetical protein
MEPNMAAEKPTLEEAIRELKDEAGFLKFRHWVMENEYSRSDGLATPIDFDRALVHAAIDRIHAAAKRERAEAARKARWWCANQLRRYLDRENIYERSFLFSQLFAISDSMKRGPESGKEGENV